MVIAEIDAELKEYGYSLVRENVTKWSGGALFNGPANSKLHIWHIYGEWHYSVKDEYDVGMHISDRLKWLINYRIIIMKSRVKTGSRNEFDMLWKEIALY